MKKNVFSMPFMDVHSYRFVTKGNRRLIFLLCLLLTFYHNLSLSAQTTDTIKINVKIDPSNLPIIPNGGCDLVIIPTITPNIVCPEEPFQICFFGSWGIDCDVNQQPVNMFFTVPSVLTTTGAPDFNINNGNIAETTFFQSINTQQNECINLSAIASYSGTLQVQINWAGQPPVGWTLVTSPATVTIKPAPLVNLTPSYPTICAGQSITINANTTQGQAPITFQWSNGATGASIVHSSNQSNSYSVTATSANGCTGSSNTVVNTVNLVADIIGNTNNICINTPTQLTATGGGTYLWSNGATSASITVTPNAATAYTVTVTGQNGCTATASRTITVQPLPIVTISPAMAAICSGSSTTLTASGGSIYAWSNGTASASTTVSPTTNTTYTVTVTNQSGCSATANRTVTVNALPIAAISPANITICAGTTTQLTASGGGSYLWSSNAANATTSSVTIAPTTTTTYTVTVTGANGCTASTSRTVNVNSITLTKTAAVSGQTITFTITVNNTGPAVTGLTLTDVLPNTLPSGATWQVTNTGGFSFNSASNTLTNVVSLAANSTVSYTIVTTINGLGTPIIGMENCVTGTLPQGSTACAPAKACVKFDVLPPSACACSLSAPIIIGTSPTSVTNFTAQFPNTTNVSNKCIYVNGALDINQNSVTFTSCNFIMQPGSSINVKTLNTLNLSGCNLKGCTNLWQGILLEPSATLTSVTTDIQDALTAIRLDNRVTVTMSRTTFNNNVFGIHSPTSSFAAPFISCSPLFFQVVNSTFESRRPNGTGAGLLPAYVGQPIQSPQGGVGFAGIQLINTDVARIGMPAPNGAVIFRYLANGIIFKDVQKGIVVNNHFNDMPATTDYTTNISFPFSSTLGFGVAVNTGNGIWAHGTKQTSLVVEGKGKNINSFNKVRRGIYEFGGVVDITQVNMNDVYTGIEVVGGGTSSNTGSQYKIADNYLGGDNRGMSLRNLNTAAPLFVNNNTVSKIAVSSFGTNGPFMGIDIDNVAPIVGVANGSSVDNNIVNGLENVFYGIRLNNTKNLELYFNLVNLNYNVSSTSNRLGIQLSGCQNVNVLNNTVRRTSTVTGVTFNDAGYQIQSSPDCVFSCNLADRTRNGFTFDGNCVNTTTISTGISNNFFDNMMFDNDSDNSSTNNIYNQLPTAATPLGLKLNQAAIIGDQVNMGNQWNNSMAWRFVSGSNFKVHSISTPSPFMPTNRTFMQTNPNYSSYNWFTQQNLPNPGNPQCTHLVAMLSNGLTQEAKDIANNDLGGVSFEQEQLWQARYDLYAKLADNPSLLNDPDFAAFFNAATGTSLPDYKALDEQKADITQTPQASLVDNLKLSLDAYYTQLMAIDALLPAEPTEADLNWVAAQKVSIMNAMSSLKTQYEQALAQHEAAQDQNADAAYIDNLPLPDDLIYEENRKTINAIYLTRLAKNDFNFSEADINQLSYIANQCPYIGGHAVYEARSIYTYIDPNYVYNDSTACAAYGIQWEKKSPLASDVLELYPNPANEVISISLKTDNEDNYQLTISDATGRTILNKQGITNTLLNIDVRHIPAGLYFVSVIKSDGSLISQKLVVQH